MKVAAGIGYRAHRLDIDTANNGDPEDCATAGHTCTYVTGSAAVLHTPTGLNVSFAAGAQDTTNNPDTNNGRFRYVKAGIRKNFFGPGYTALYGEYYDSSKEAGASGSADDITVNFWGLGAVQKIDAAATELYIGYRLYSTGTQGAAGAANRFEDLTMVMGGMRIKF